MERLQFRFILAAVVLFSLTTVPILNAAPVRFNQVVQVVNAKPGKADAAGFTQLRLGGDVIVFSGNDDNDNDKNKKKDAARPQQDDRVITETTVEIVEEEVCDCEDIPVRGGGFPYWVLPFAAIPFFFIPWDSPTPTPGTPTPTPGTPTPTPGTPTPTPTTPTPTPGTPTPTPGTPTPTPGTPTPTPMTPTPTPMTPTPTPMTPTPTPPEPIPEPITILLFGTGLAGVGLAARRKFGKKKKQEESED